MPEYRGVLPVVKFDASAAAARHETVAVEAMHAARERRPPYFGAPGAPWSGRAPPGRERVLGKIGIPDRLLVSMGIAISAAARRRTEMERWVPIMS